MIQHTGDFNRALNAANRVFQLLDRRPKIEVNQSAGLKLDQVDGNIELREGVRSRSSLSPERRKNSWSLYFNPWHRYYITRVFLRLIAFRICITLICGKCIWKEKNHVKDKKSTYFWSKTVKFFLHTSLEATLSSPLWTPTIMFYTSMETSWP